MNEPKITIIDSPMGSGKTTWAIETLLNANPDGNYIYITPFLSEIDRIINATKDHRNKPILAPLNKGEGKLDAINKLLLRREDIAATHELFKHLDEDSQKYIECGNYTLILDEVLDVISPYNIKHGDLELLISGNWLSINEEGYLVWNPEVPDWDTSFDEVKILAEKHQLVCVNGTILLWRYPPEVFRMFNKVYVMTYLFESSILCAYLKYNEMNYEKKSVTKIDDHYELTDFTKFDPSIFAPLINIYDEPKLRINQKNTGLSKSWFIGQDKDTIKKLKNNIYNYYKHITKATKDTIMWTCFKSDYDVMKGSGYTKGFVSCNCRSTNDFADRYNLVYAINRYLNPGVPLYFSKKNIVINEDLYALSEMLQWIWRSRIRNGEPINIYIPSNRMRWLLKNWLNNKLPENSNEIK